MILRDKQDFTVLHLFSGSGGGALGFKRVGFHSLGSIDLDPIACRDLERLTGERAICADILAMGPADLPARRRELACLQSFPDDFMFEGSDSSSKTQPGIREHIGNAVPPLAAEAIAVECMAALMSSADGGYHLSNGNIWVRPEIEWAA